MKIGGGVNNEGLVFGYDSSGFKFGGEPTTNKIPSPQNNGRFTTSNGWSTYNTNQYNGAQYFSIGTIGSVTNNIVTLSSVGRNIRSFDVLRAQTTGGGVTAGTDYVIKKISSTEFSLHTYNGSQNGSQGYINPDTGFFKVHDAYATDTRVPISASGFPTMWWGAPHLPNSGLIKEIVVGGGRISGTNCMRLHVYRNDGVADGMAYGVNTPVNVGDIITMSVWLKFADNRNLGGGLSYSTHFGGYAAPGTGFSNITTDWKRYEFTWTASVDYSFISYWWPAGTSTPYAIDMCDFQVEVNKGHATNFTTGTRTNTEALIDISSSNTIINTTNIGWSSEQYPSFNGVDQYLNATGTLYSTTDSWTADLVFKSLDDLDTSWSAIFGGPLNDGGYFMFHSGQLTYYEGVFASVTKIKYFGLTKTTYFPQDIYKHLLIRYNGDSTYDIFINNTKSSHNHIFGGSSSLRLSTIGGAAGNRFGNQEIPSFRFYERGLTDNEVEQNYLSFKNRFGIV